MRAVGGPTSRRRPTSNASRSARGRSATYAPMYLIAPSAVRETEVFTAMPEKFRRRGVRTAWADANRGGAETDSFLEGPVFDALGNLYVADIPYGRVFRIDPAGDWALVAEF